MICKEGGPFVSDVSSNGIAVDDSFQVPLGMLFGKPSFRENSV